MKVVLDSNIIVADFWMQSPNFQVLLESSKKGNIDLMIPELVMDEVINKFNQRIDKSRNDIGSELATLNKLTNNEIENPVGDGVIEKAKKAYKKHFEKIISINKITILPYPKTEHKYLARKAMLKLKPFNTNEKGYRDCLIWENIKSLISSDDLEDVITPEIIFVTNNSKDFSSDTGKVNEDLLAELQDESHNTESLEIHSSLGEFNDKIAKLFLLQASIFEGKLKSNSFWDFELKANIDAFLFKEFINSNLNNYYEFAPYANDTPMVVSIDDSYTIENITVKKLNAKEYIVDVQFNLETEIEYYIDKSDLWSNDDIGAHVLDSDWNDWVALVGRTVSLPLFITLIINSNLECTSIEINKIDNEYT